MHTTATAQATETRNPLSFDEIQVSAWLLSENKPHEVEIALDRNGFALALHFTQEDAQELSSQLNKALQSIAEAKELTLERTGTTILIGQ